MPPSPAKPRCCSCISTMSPSEKKSFTLCCDSPEEICSCIARCRSRSVSAISQRDERCKVSTSATATETSPPARLGLVTAKELSCVAGSDQALLAGQDRRFSATGNVQLLVDRLDVVVHGEPLDAHQARDLLDRETLAEVGQYLAFARGQAL